MANYTIYHNPRCSKSRQTLALLNENGIEPEIVLYLDNTPSHSELTGLIQKLDITPRDLLRKGETEYKEQNLANKDLTDDSLIQAMVGAPKLIERPIVVCGDRAVLGRPPENILDLV